MNNKELNFSLENLNENKTIQLARLYAQVFAAPPWNEVVKCDNCQQFQGYGTSLGDKCDDCGGTFREAYPLVETSNYIAKESRKPGYRIATAESGSNLIAFSWSYLTTPLELALSKWSTPKNQMIAIDILRQQGLQDNSPIRYLSETAVNPEYRNQGLASQLRSETTGPEITIARTNCLSPMTAINYKQGFTQIMGPRVMVFRQSQILLPTAEVVNCLDPGNSSRVLFIKKP